MGEHSTAERRGIAWCESALEAAKGADVLVVLTEWSEFRALDLVSSS
jgi:UDPglucose 6-dehydrogenase